MTEYLNTGFEGNDLSDFDGTVTSSGCTSEVLSTDPYLGTYHAHFETDADGLYAYVYFNDGETLDLSEIYTAIYVKFLSLPTGNRQMCLIHRGSYNVSQLRIKTGGSPETTRLRLEGKDGEDWLTAGYGSALMTGQWYFIQLYTKIHSTAGIHRVYLNDVLDLEILNVDSSLYGNIERVEVGIPDCAEAVELYLDRVIVADSMIEPEEQEEESEGGAGGGIASIMQFLGML